MFLHLCVENNDRLFSKRYLNKKFKSTENIVSYIIWFFISNSALKIGEIITIKIFQKKFLASTQNFLTFFSPQHRLNLADHR